MASIKPSSNPSTHLPLRFIRVSASSSSSRIPQASTGARYEPPYAAHAASVLDSRSPSRPFGPRHWDSSYPPGNENESIVRKVHPTAERHTSDTKLKELAALAPDMTRPEVSSTTFYEAGRQKAK
jgi:hypothetical protein